MHTLTTAKTGARWLAWVGLVCGVLYSVGGFFIDLRTIGLNGGTVLAFGALIGMPVAFGIVGFAAGAAGSLCVRGAAWLRDRAGK
jgi:hypothetical protein